MLGGLDLDQQPNRRPEGGLWAEQAFPRLAPRQHLPGFGQAGIAVTVGIDGPGCAPARLDRGAQRLSLDAEQGLILQVPGGLRQLHQAGSLVVQHGDQFGRVDGGDIHALGPGMPDIEYGVVLEAGLEQVIPLGDAVPLVVMGGGEPGPEEIPQGREDLLQERRVLAGAVDAPCQRSEEGRGQQAAALASQPGAGVNLAVFTLDAQEVPQDLPGDMR